MSLNNVFEWTSAFCRAMSLDQIDCKKDCDKHPTYIAIF